MKENFEEFKMYTKEQQIEKIKRFISEKEDDIKYLKEKLAELLNEDIDKKKLMRMMIYLKKLMHLGKHHLIG